MKISIITVAYNSAQTIRDTLQSVLDQTYQDIEYIIIDGASQDGTQNILKQYESLFNGRMRWISERDNGLYDAMNKGICLATGDIVGILNSDDFFTDNSVLENISHNFISKDIDAIYGDIHFVRPDNLNKCVRYYSSKHFHPRYLRFGLMPAHPSFYVKRQCYEKYGLYSLDYKISSDFDIITRFFYKYKIRYSYIPMDFVTMRTGGASTESWKSRMQINKEDIQICKKYGIYSNWIFMFLRYFYKIKEIL